jgi:NitT/TauT family transport system ATP-binding protein
VAFGLRMRAMGQRQASAKALDYLEDVGLGACAGKIPAELSGGMKQRVALARALALKPGLLLMDEPFAALDYQTRKIMQRYVLSTRERTGATILLVTHDLAEALTLADRLILMSGAPGSVQGSNRHHRAASARSVPSCSGWSDAQTGSASGGRGCPE